VKVKDPVKYQVDQKPAEINVLDNRPRTKKPAQNMADHLSFPPAMGFPYGYYPPPFPPPSTWYSQPSNPVPGPAPTPLPAPRKTIKISDYPQITTWLNYCDSHPDRRGEYLSSHAEKFDQEGYRRINQLTGDRVSVEKLSDWLGIGKGTADLLIRYAEEDIELIKDGIFTMEQAADDWAI
jgi:hypothetical protein